MGQTKKLLTLVLSFQMVFGMQTWAREAPKSNFKTYNRFLQDPFLEEIANNKDIPLELGLSADDPTLDQDPFFLRAQEWVQNSNRNAKQVELDFSEEAQNVSVHVPGTNKVLKINQALKPLAVTDDYIFFSGNENFKEFEKKSQGLEVPGEGIFFISYQELLSASDNNIRVPMYFLPLPGVGWVGDGVLAAHFAQNEILAVSNNQGESIPINLNDIEEIRKAERFNLFLAVTFTMIHMGSDVAQVTDMRMVLPDSKITAGFGVLFTGINSRNYADSLFALESSNRFQNLAQNFLKSVISVFKIPSAQASPLDPKLIQRMIRVGVVTSLALAASIVLKYTVYKNHFISKHTKENGDKKIGLGKKAKQNIGDIGDVFAHSLTTFSKFASMTSANLVEFLGDRYFPQLASADNTMIRKFLNKTVYFVRGSNDRIPVSGKTWVYGSIILGGIDTFFVALQLYYVVPYLGKHVGEHLPMLQPRIDEAFAIGNPNVASIRQNDVIRNAVGYITAGASNFSSDLQSQILDKVTAEVKEQMKSEGLDPESPRNKAELERRSEVRLNAEMQKLGLPSKTDFLFDATTLYSGTMALLGYSLPPEAVKNKLEPSQFLAANRPGLVISSAHSAIEALKRRRTFNTLQINDVHVNDAIKLLTESVKEMNILRGFVRAPIEALLGDKGYKYYLNQFRTARQKMMLLSYSGDPAEVIPYLPDSWQKASPQAVELAIKVYRSSLSYSLEGEKAEPKPYTPEKKGFIAKWQEKKATSQASTQYLAKYGKTFNPLTANNTEVQNFKAIYAQTLSNVLGLYPDYSDKAEYEAEILAKTSIYTTQRLNEPEIKTYLSTLDRAAQVQYEAEVQALTFIRAYREVIFTSGSVPSLSPAQPGRFQSLRQKSWVRNNNVLTRLVRAAEAFVPGDQLAMGRKAFLERNVPGWFDFKQANLRAYRGALTGITAAYAFNYLVWGINLPIAFWTLHLVTTFAIGAPAQFLNRFFRYQDLKPMGGVLSMLGYGFVYTWATFGGMLPEAIFANDFAKGFEWVFKGHLREFLMTASALGVFMLSKDKIVETAKNVGRKVSEKYNEVVSACARALSFE